MVVTPFLPRIRPSRCPALLAIFLACAGCTPAQLPPPTLVFAGLPVSGDRDLARRSGFGACLNVDAAHMRCRRHDVMLYGEGPYEAAVDLKGGEGESGFDQLTLWHDDDQDRVYRVIIGLTRAGWRYCYTGTEMYGDQAVFTKPAEPIRISMDISYWGKRRIRIIPAGNMRGLDTPCTPDGSLVRFGSEVATAAVR